MREQCEATNTISRHKAGHLGAAVIGTNQDTARNWIQTLPMRLAVLGAN